MVKADHNDCSVADYARHWREHELPDEPKPKRQCDLVQEYFARVADHESYDIVEVELMP